jgi:hypothetical protein
MRMAARGAAAVAAAVTGIAMVAGCGGSAAPKAAPAAGATSEPPGATSAPTPSASPSPSATPSPSLTATAPITTSSTRLSPALLTLTDLPAGFTRHELGAKNLPSLIHGCAGLEALQQTGIGDIAQGEWANGGLTSAYIDEAVIEPKGVSAAGLVAESAKALDACGSVQVVEEGFGVTLTAKPLSLAEMGDASHAWKTTGDYAGIPMELNVVLVQQGGLVVLLAQTHIGGHADDALTLQAAQAAAARAAAFQKKNT